MRFAVLCCCAFFVCSQAVAEDLGSQPSDKPAETSGNPVDGINKFLKGVTDSINDAVAQAQKPKDKGAQPNSASAPQPDIWVSTHSQTTQPQPQSQPQPVKDNGTPLSATSLNGIFAKHPYDGTAKSQYPKVAITVTDWSSSECWRARAKIWWSEKKSEPVSTFSVCWRDSLARALDNVVTHKLFLRQMSLGHSGNVRTEGPKPPMMAYPMPDPFGVANYAKGQQANSFVQQILTETGWQAGGQTNLWIVGYDTGGR